MGFKHAFVITGSIGSGKSTAMNLLKLHGFKTIDADKISHEILDKNADIISSKFGNSFVNNGVVDRKKLGRLVFNDKKKLEELENNLHPKIREEIYKQAKKLEITDLPYFVDIPLFFEKKGYEFNNVCLVYAPKDLLIKRVLERDGLSKEEVLKRLEYQEDIEIKKANATYVIDNSKDLKQLNLEVENFLICLKEKYATL